MEIMICDFVIGNDGDKNIPCGRTFTEKWKYNLHKKKLLTSSHGPQTVQKPYGLTLNIGDGKVWKCKYCQATFESKAIMFKHQIKHTEYQLEKTEGVYDQNYTCDFVVDIDPVNN